jgi:hypothetical protein
MGQNQKFIIQLEDQFVDKNVYNKVIQKFYAIVRFKLYQQIREYCDKNKNLIADQQLIEDTVILEMAQSINQSQIYEQIFDLYQIKCQLDPLLTIREM